MCVVCQIVMKATLPVPMASLVCQAVIEAVGLQCVCRVSDCDEGYFTCADGQSCVPVAHYCDFKEDCADGSDEDSCGRTLSAVWNYNNGHFVILPAQIHSHT